jgi:hypothetical protein
VWKPGAELEGRGGGFYWEVSGRRGRVSRGTGTKWQVLAKCLGSLGWLCVTLFSVQELTPYLNRKKPRLRLSGGR